MSPRVGSLSEAPTPLRERSQSSSSVDTEGSTEPGPETIEDSAAQTSSSLIEEDASSSSSVLKRELILESDGEVCAHGCGVNQENSPKRSRDVIDTDTTRMDLPLAGLTVNGQYDVLDSTQKWCEGEVMKIDHELQRVFVSYIFWSSGFDEWVDDVGHRVAPLHTHTYCDGGVLKTGQRIEVLDERSIWLEAFVIDESELQVKIHYKNFHPKFDEWIDRDNRVRIQPFGRSKPVSLRSVSVGPSRTGNNNSNSHRSSSSNSSNSSSSSSNSNSSSSSRGNGNGSTRNTASNPSIAAQCAFATNKFQQQSTFVGSSQVASVTSPLANVTNHQRRIADSSVPFARYQQALAAQGLTLVHISGDGNCLFRSIAHQIYGDESLHVLVRAKCVDYMQQEADFFSQFVVGGEESFHMYLEEKRRLGTWGDDPEITAMSEIYCRPVDIYAFDASTGAQKLKTFHERNNHSRMRSMDTNAVNNNRAPAIRLSYYGGGHFDSIVESSRSAAALSFNRRLPGELENEALLRGQQLRAEHASRSEIDFSAKLDLCLERSLSEFSSQQLQATDALVLEDVQRSSEKDFLEQVLVQSVANDLDVEEQLLQSALLQSTQPVGHSEPATIMPSVVSVTGRQQLDQLSEMTADEQLQFALQQSLLPSQPAQSAVVRNSPPLSSTQSTSQLLLSDDDMLQLALAQSLQASQSSFNGNSGNSAHEAVFSGDEFDEELMLAIQESLKK